MSFFFFYKIREQVPEQVLLGNLVTVGKGKRLGKGVRR
jgi:hypothetical protein